jgi:hypothetical protein
MTGGMNLRGRIWRMQTVGRDDDIGGAVPSGTIVYDNISARLSPLEPTMALLEQGLETEEVYNGVFQYPYLPLYTQFDVRHNDQFEVTWPPINIHVNKKFVFIGVQYQSYDDQRKYVVGQLRRLVTANANDLQ